MDNDGVFNGGFKSPNFVTYEKYSVKDIHSLDHGE